MHPPTLVPYRSESDCSSGVPSEEVPHLPFTRSLRGRRLVAGLPIRGSAVVAGKQGEVIGK